jgi:EAL domain-containing protein (putative c-di-GMP-specific phosphodiesterase class I)
MTERIVAAIDRPFEIGGEPISVRAHAGIAAARPGERPGDVIRGACLALQRAADDKRQIVVLDERLREQTHDSHLLESHLREAIEAGELYVMYQPIIWLDGDEHEAYEALLRWDHQTYGGVPPPMIIELAQRSGVLSHVSELVLTVTCAQIAAWKAEGRRANVGVNIAAADLLNPEFARRATEIVRNAGIHPSQITFELTEETAIGDLQQAETVMRTLRQHGFLLAIDDFGTGYASLTYLERLPVDMIKLDRLFVAKLTGDSRCDAILKAIVPLAHALEFRVIGEGVETQLQLDLLTDLGCDAIQGFLVGEPRMPGECRAPVDRLALV